MALRGPQFWDTLWVSSSQYYSCPFLKPSYYYIYYSCLEIPGFCSVFVGNKHKSISAFKEQLMMGSVYRMGWRPKLELTAGNILELKTGGMKITNPNKCIGKREIPQNHHRFVLFDSPKMGDLITPGKCSGISGWRSKPHYVVHVACHSVWKMVIHCSFAHAHHNTHQRKILHLNLLYHIVLMILEAPYNQLFLILPKIFIHPTFGKPVKVTRTSELTSSGCSQTLNLKCRWWIPFHPPKGQGTLQETNLVGGWTNPFEKYARQNGFIFPKFRDENKKLLKQPPSNIPSKIEWDRIPTDP